MGEAVSRFNKAKLLKRFISAAVMAPVTLYIVYIGGFFLAGFLFILFGLSFYEWLKVAQKTTRPWFYRFVGVIYLSISFTSFFYIANMRVPSPIDDIALMDFPFEFILLFLIWFSDIGAYFFGKFIGGAKLWPSVSPNKTWAGLLGALILPAIFLLGIDFVIAGFIFTPFVFFYIPVAVFIGILSQAGDLLISKYKRIANVKDTGDLIPGHGGILDRIDGILFVCFCFSPISFYLFFNPYAIL